MRNRQQPRGGTMSPSGLYIDILFMATKHYIVVLLSSVNNTEQCSQVNVKHLARPPTRCRGPSRVGPELPPTADRHQRRLARQTPKHRATRPFAHAATAQHHGTAAGCGHGHSHESARTSGRARPRAPQTRPGQAAHARTAHTCDMRVHRRVNDLCTMPS